tara:strand:- start:40154 stop:41473 length:1320 start_codon:yes stop_codon:yes gene_type:complete
VIDTIIATATPPGTGGISVIRLSGPTSVNSTALISKKHSSFFKERLATLCSVFNDDGVVIDKCVITYFKSPNSYTGEDVIEVSCHGNPLIVDSIITSFLSTGVRLAHPGEFTKRAFLNGKIDLVQAESVASLISSRSSKSLSFANNALSGKVSNLLINLREDVISVLSVCEYELDISDDETGSNINSKCLLSITNIAEKCRSILSTSNNARYYFTGASVVITGKPNVGKSTLFNALVGLDRAIVGDAPGTTRDYIDANIIIEGIPIRLIDTAGDRESIDEVEMAGVRRSKDIVQDSDLSICVYDVIDNIEHKEHNIHVLNKIDIKNNRNNHDTERTVIPISAKKGTGIPSLKSAISSALLANGSQQADSVLTTKRQADSMILCYKHLMSASDILKEETPRYELVAFEIRESVSHLDQVLGRTHPDDILNKIFNNFCVGK